MAELAMRQRTLCSNYFWMKSPAGEWRFRARMARWSSHQCAVDCKNGEIIKLRVPGAGIEK